MAGHAAPQELPAAISPAAAAAGTCLSRYGLPGGGRAGGELMVASAVRPNPNPQAIYLTSPDYGSESVSSAKQISPVILA
jgi:hypothetical protein